MHHWKICRRNLQVFQCHRVFLALHGSGARWALGVLLLFIGGRGCIDAVTIEGDKIFAQVTSCTQANVGIYYPLYNQHFIHDLVIEFVVRNCIWLVLMIIENWTLASSATASVKQVTNSQACFHKNPFVPAQKTLFHKDGLLMLCYSWWDIEVYSLVMESNPQSQNKIEIILSPKWSNPIQC